MAGEQPTARFGLNAKEMILRLAAGEGSDSEDDDNDPNPNPTPSTTANQHQQPQTVLGAIKLGSKYFQATDVRHRPSIPFIARPRMPRIVRQRHLDRLFGQHMALEAHKAGDVDVDIAAKHEPLRKRAAEFAIAQEKELYDKCYSATVYSNLAARVSAIDWAPAVAVTTTSTAGTAANDISTAAKNSDGNVVVAKKKVEDVYGELLDNAAKQKREKEEKEARQQQYNDRKRQKILTQQQPQKVKLNKNNNKVVAPVLEEDDLDWDNPQPDIEPNNCTVEKDNIKGSIKATAQTQPPSITLNAHNRQQHHRQQQQQIRQPPPPPYPPPPPPSLSPAEAILKAFIDLQLEIAVAKGALPADKKQGISERCVAKITNRHKDQGMEIDVDIVEKEGEAIKKLVNSYVKHVNGG